MGGGRAGMGSGPSWLGVHADWLASGTWAVGPEMPSDSRPLLLVSGRRAQTIPDTCLGEGSSESRTIPNNVNDQCVLEGPAVSILGCGRDSAGGTAYARKVLFRWRWLERGREKGVDEGPKFGLAKCHWGPHLSKLCSLGFFG